MKDADYDLTTLAGRVKWGMDRVGYKGTDLEDAAKLPKGYSSRILRGGRKNLGPKMMSRIAQALKLEHDWLANGVGVRVRSESSIPPPERSVELEHLPAELDDAIRSRPGGGRWHADTIAVVRSRAERAASRGARRTRDEWTAELLEVETALFKGGLIRSNDEAQRHRDTENLLEQDPASRRKTRR